MRVRDFKWYSDLHVKMLVGILETKQNIYFRMEISLGPHDLRSRRLNNKLANKIECGWAMS